MADSYVCSGAIMRCSMGTSQAKLTVLPSRTVFLAGQPMANISDHRSMMNLAPFGRCRSLGFPATASATAANHGSLTPMPCMHNTPFPWIGGKNDHIVKGQPALLKSSTCQCMWGGTISIIDNGQHGEGTQWVQKRAKQEFDIVPFENFLKDMTEWFKNPDGFKKLSVNEPGYDNSNGYTRLDGSVFLKEEILKDSTNAFKKIQNNKVQSEEKKERLTREEERSLATLWHEITHNMHDTNNDSQPWWELSGQNTKYMETANEFVARKTLPEFYKALGEKMSYPEFMNGRENTGYDRWVRKYDEAIAQYNLDEKVVLEVVKKGLLESDYHKQKTNLINGLIMGGQIVDNETQTCRYKISPNDAAMVVKRLLD